MSVEGFDDIEPETVFGVRGGTKRKMERETGMNERMIGSKKDPARFLVIPDVSPGLLEALLLAHAVIDNDSVITEGKSMESPSEACFRCVSVEEGDRANDNSPTIDDRQRSVWTKRCPLVPAVSFDCIVSLRASKFLTEERTSRLF